MLNSTPEYKEAIVGRRRRIFLKAVVDISDPDISYSGAVGDQEPYSQPDQVYDKDFDITRYSTLEDNRWALDGSCQFIPNNTPAPQIGFVGDELCDKNGVFPSPVYAELQFSNVSVLQACCVYFSKDPVDGVASSFMVEVKQGGVSYHTQKFEDNVESAIFLSGFTVNNPDAIRVTVTKWSKPHRRLRVVEIVPGVYEEWGNSDLATFSVSQKADTSCLSLPYGTCSLSMDNSSRRFEPRKKDGLFKSIEDRQNIDLYIGVRLPDQSVEYKPIGRYYQSSGGWKTGDNSLSMKWSLVDIIGLLSKRTYLPPDTLPTTLEGWVNSIVSQLGKNFVGFYRVDHNYADLPLIVGSKEKVSGLSCGEVLRYVCMATGTWPRADASTGKLAVEPYWSEGNKLTLDNMPQYPVISANEDVAALIFTINGENPTQYVVSGNSTSSSNTVSINNPFIKTEESALVAAKLILATYGGNQLEVTGRGDPSSEIGDVDTVWLDESTATTGRRIQQSFTIKDGVLQGCKSVLLQADGFFLYQNRTVITSNMEYTAPAGAKSLRVILVGKGQDGGRGSDGTWESQGANGVNGSGALVWSDRIPINPEQKFSIRFEGDHTIFGPYSSQNGKSFPQGYTDVQSGESFARTGVANPLPGSGDGGLGGPGGEKGNKYEEKYITQDGIHRTEEIIVNYPGYGKPGATGARGCVVIYWEVDRVGNG